jgi:hypothetical protein
VLQDQEDMAIPPAKLKSQRTDHKKTAVKTAPTNETAMRPI